MSKAYVIKSHRFFFFSTVHLCDNEMRGWQEIIHSTESVIQGVIVKYPLQKCTLLMIQNSQGSELILSFPWCLKCP